MKPTGRPGIKPPTNLGRRLGAFAACICHSQQQQTPSLGATRASQHPNHTLISYYSCICFHDHFDAPSEDLFMQGSCRDRLRAAALIIGKTCFLLFTTIGGIPCSFFATMLRTGSDKETTFFRYIDFATSWFFELESVGPGFGERIENANSFFYKKKITLTPHTIFSFHQHLCVTV
jgi:hypothetical protein